MAGNKTRASCWTCRLRKKRCDSVRPVCRSCAALEIRCFGGDARPAWMDGGAQQREMAERIKCQVRDRAQGRRERQQAAAGTAIATDGEPAFVVTLQQTVAAEMAVIEAGDGAPSSDRIKGITGKQSTAADAAPATVLDLAHRTDIDRASGPAGATATATATSATSATTATRPSLTAPGLAWELDFTMIYLDHVFPFLFPFYRPPLVGTSRAWLLTFLRQSQTVFHSVLSLSAFFFTVGLRAVYGEREPCKWAVWALVEQQAGLSLEQMQRDLAAAAAAEATSAGDISSGSPAPTPAPAPYQQLRDKARLMQTILQLLVFELFVSRTADWRVHLVPALALFEEVLQEADEADEADEAAETTQTSRPLSLPGNDYSPSWATTRPGLIPVLAHMAWTRPPIRGLERPVWNPDQAAFRFFAAQLLVMDIVASTALGRPPRLQRHHARLLADIAPEDIGGPLDLSAFVGCRNSVLMSIGEIAGLAGRAEAEAEVERQARRIGQTLDDALRQDDGCSATSATRIWALAARIYLAVALHRRRASDPLVAGDVAATLALLQAVDSVAQLRTFAWPLCIAGCLAVGTAQREAFFARVSENGGHPQLLSGLRQAGRIMEAVWATRETATEPLDVTACLCILGTPAMLV